MSAQDTGGDPRDEVEVVRYLRENPAFLERHAGLLESLELEHASGDKDACDGKTSSLIEKQVALLRTRNSDLAGRLDALIETARSNENLSIGLHRLLLKLMGADAMREGLRA